VDTRVEKRYYKREENGKEKFASGGLRSGSVKILTLSTKKPASKHLDIGFRGSGFKVQRFKG
jgi:hypothetical protein